MSQKYNMILNFSIFLLDLSNLAMSSGDDRQPTYLTNLGKEKTGPFEFFNISENNMTTVVSKLPQGRYYHTLCSFLAAQICVHYHAIHKTKNHESNQILVSVRVFFLSILWYLKIWQKFPEKKRRKISQIYSGKTKKNSSTIFPISFVNKNKKGPKTIVPNKTLVSVCVCVCVCVPLLHAFLEFGTGVFFRFGLVWFGLVCCCEKENCEKIYTFLTIIVKF